MPPSDSVHAFLSVSGASDPAIARAYLEAEGYDVERALDSYFESTSRAARGNQAPPPQPSPPPYLAPHPPPIPAYNGAPPAPPPGVPPPCAPPPYTPYPPPYCAPPPPACSTPPIPPVTPPYPPYPATPHPVPFPMAPPAPPYGPPPFPPQGPTPPPPPGGVPPVGPLHAGLMGVRPPPPPPPCGSPPIYGLPPLAEKALSAQFLIITRPVEWANVLSLGMLENANKYKVSNPEGKYVARIVEHHEGFTNEFGRHLLGNHRGFCASMLSAEGDEGSQVFFRVRRPAYVFKSDMYIEDAGGFVLGTIRQKFELNPKKWRKHDIFLLGRHLGTLSDSNYSDNFQLKDPWGGLLAMVYREWQGVGKEIFTDAGKYVVHFGQPLTPDARPPPAPLVSSDLEVARPLDLLERAAVLAALVSVDFLHFSTSSEPWFKYGPSIVL